MYLYSKFAGLSGEKYDRMDEIKSFLETIELRRACYLNSPSDMEKENMWIEIASQTNSLKKVFDEIKDYLIKEKGIEIKYEDFINVVRIIWFNRGASELTSYGKDKKEYKEVSNSCLFDHVFIGHVLASKVIGGLHCFYRYEHLKKEGIIEELSVNYDSNQMKEVIVKESSEDTLSKPNTLVKMDPMDEFAMYTYAVLSYGIGQKEVDFSADEKCWFIIDPTSNLYNIESIFLARVNIRAQGQFAKNDRAPVRPMFYLELLVDASTKIK